MTPTRNVDEMEWNQVQRQEVGVEGDRSMINKKKWLLAKGKLAEWNQLMSSVMRAVECGTWSRARRGDS